MADSQSKALAYARLLRLSSAPSALADVWMGYVVTNGAFDPAWPLLWMTLASLCLLHGGMALNDAVDAAADERDNRGRPIAAGLVPRGVAFASAAGLLACGIGLAVGAWLAGGALAGPIVATALAACVVAYNSPLKRTAIGPLLMASCRVLNVALGVTALPLLDATPAVETMRYVGPGVLLYIIGVTLFARDEAFGGRRPVLLAALLITLMGVAWHAAAPWFFEGPTPLASVAGGFLLFSVTGWLTTRGMTAAVLRPTPQSVGRGVGIALRGIIVIDIALATLYGGPTVGLLMIGLIPLATILAQWIPPT